ncbi:hypothetical protein MRX96_057521 [Rhipicephalus microplus]
MLTSTDDPMIGSGSHLSYAHMRYTKRPTDASVPLTLLKTFQSTAIMASTADTTPNAVAAVFRESAMPEPLKHDL